MVSAVNACTRVETALTLTPVFHVWWAFFLTASALTNAPKALSMKRYKTFHTASSAHKTVPDASVPLNAYFVPSATYSTHHACHNAQTVFSQTMAHAYSANKTVVDAKTATRVLLV
jgi:hypothetical protein